MVKEGGSPEQQEMIDYAFAISGGNKEFVYVMNGENGNWTITRKHGGEYVCPLDGNVHDDYGMGISSCWHGEIVWDPRFFTDWQWHLDEAWRLWSTGTPFYGYAEATLTFIPNAT